eukprot:122827-Heterocapsa_arctica.AAC.1
MVLILPSLKCRQAGSADPTEQRAVYEVRLASQACSDLAQFGAQVGNARGFRPNGEAHALVDASKIENYAKSDHELR